jgi:hypothetical protein
MWKYIARSAIGTSHQKLDLPCQDYGDCQVKGHCLVGAVADGAGSAKFAELGSRAVVKSALRFITTHGMPFMDEDSRSLGKKILRVLNLDVNTDVRDVIQVFKSDGQFPTEHEVNTFFRELLEGCIEDLQREAKQHNCDVKDLASTLLVFIAHRDWLVGMQVGDGLLVVRKRQEKDYQLAMKPYKGEFANDTMFVTSDGAIASMQTVVLPKPCDFICAATDGIQNVAVRLSDWSPFGPFFLPLEEYLRETDNPEDNDQYLMDFLNSDRLNARTDDDKTLLIAVSNDSSN